VWVNRVLRPLEPRYRAAPVGQPVFGPSEWHNAADSACPPECPRSAYVERRSGEGVPVRRAGVSQSGTSGMPLPVKANATGTWQLRAA